MKKSELWSKITMNESVILAENVKNYLYLIAPKIAHQSTKKPLFHTKLGHKNSSWIISAKNSLHPQPISYKDHQKIGLEKMPWNYLGICGGTTCLTHQGMIKSGSSLMINSPLGMSLIAITPMPLPSIWRLTKQFWLNFVMFTFHYENFTTALETMRQR